MSEQLQLCGVEQRYIDRGFADGSDELINDIYNTEFKELKATWEELSPEGWVVLTSLFSGTDEKRVLLQQRKALRKRWKTMVKTIIENAKHNSNSNNTKPIEKSNDTATN